MHFKKFGEHTGIIEFIFFYSVLFAESRNHSENNLITREEF